MIVGGLIVDDSVLQKKQYKNTYASVVILIFTQLLMQKRVLVAKTH